MKLQSRLNTLKRQSGAGTPLQAPSATVSVADRLHRARNSKTPHRVTDKAQKDALLAKRMGGRLLCPGVIEVEQRMALRSRHGRVSLHHLQQAQLEFPEFSQLNPKKCLFFDTETTGLSGGTGTHVFMLGMGRIEGEEFVVRQLMLTSFSGESAFLEASRAWLSEAECVVSFNGKCFDSPLLTSRFRLAGQDNPSGEKPHIDLLYNVRRAFADVWQDCRLSTTEKRLLGFKRVDDLPGAQAPEAWLAYVRFGDAGLLPRVAEHNYWDIVSLAALLVSVADVFERPYQYRANVWRIARFYCERGQLEKAKAMLELNRTKLDADALLLLANIYRQLDHWDSARGIWERLAATGCPLSFERLAKYFEHVKKDYRQALYYAEQLPESSQRSYRVARLHKRSGRPFMDTN